MENLIIKFILCILMIDSWITRLKESDLFSLDVSVCKYMYWILGSFWSINQVWCEWLEIQKLPPTCQLGKTHKRFQRRFLSKEQSMASNSIVTKSLVFGLRNSRRLHPQTSRFSYQIRHWQIRFTRCLNNLNLNYLNLHIHNDVGVACLSLNRPPANTLSVEMYVLV